MLFQKLALFSAIAAIASAQDVDNNDVPQECRAICAPLIASTQQCDNQTNDDAAELSCICTSANAGTVIPACDACVTQFRRPDNDDDDRNDVSDVREILNRCNLTTTTYNSASASNMVSSMANRPSGTAAPAPGGVVVMTSGTVVMTTSVAAPRTSTAGAGPAQQSTAGSAPAQTAAAALGLGALGIAMGLL